ncbi:MAG: T9SS type A sorting domain-containing protein [Saprospiraceae bacterium]
MSWTIGDLVTQTASFGEGITTQGFQQPIISVKKLDTPALDPINVSQGTSQKFPSPLSADFNAEIYPNPVNTDVTVNISNSNQEYYLDLLDPAGNLLSRSKSQNAQEVIHMAQLPAAQYILRISIPDAQQTKVFQIIKTN